MSGKDLIKSIFSDVLIGKVTGLFYGWHGNYSSWSQAKSRCKGYADKDILEKVIETAISVKNGQIAFERDSVPFDKKIYSYPVLAALMWIATQRNNRLNVLDFGGALGSSYYQNSHFLNSLSGVNWCIVEQPHFVDAGRKNFETDELHFFYDVDECLLTLEIDAVLLSGVIQYMEKPYELILDLVRRNLEYIIIDRTLFYPDRDRLTIQKVPKKIYDASYCCWILNESKILNIVSEKYDLIYDFDIRETINLNAMYKGYLFRKKPSH